MIFAFIIVTSLLIATYVAVFPKTKGVMRPLKVTVRR